MKIGLINIDSKIPNLALMKISAYHKAKGNTVSWFDMFETYDKVYSSKVFSYTPDYGTGLTLFSISTRLTLQVPANPVDICSR